MSDEDTKSWIYAGGLPYELTEGDIVCVFSQYGEILEITLSRDKETGKSRGFCFLKYEDPRSCELAVDNLHGTTIVGRKIKVSLANNSVALKSRRPAIVAPQEDSTLPIVEDDKYRRQKRKQEDLSPSPTDQKVNRQVDRYDERKSNSRDHRSYKSERRRDDSNERSRGVERSSYRDEKPTSNRGRDDSCDKRSSRDRTHYREPSSHHLNSSSHYSHSRGDSKRHREEDQDKYHHSDKSSRRHHSKEHSRHKIRESSTERHRRKYEERSERDTKKDRHSSPLDRHHHRRKKSEKSSRH